MDPDLCLAVDIGGTKLAAGVVSATGELMDRVTEPTGDPADAEALHAKVEALVGRFAPFERYVACGVGCGGPMSPDGELVSPLNIEVWRDFPLAERLRSQTGLRVWLDNDAKALALAEGWVGAATGHQNFMAMVVSTGVGGGIVLDGRLLEGRMGNAGHVGHVVVSTPGRSLPGHVDGVLEAEASGTAIAAHTGGPAAEASHDERVTCGTLVGRAVGSTANLLDLPLVVVAGSVALGYGATFFDAAQSEIDRVCQLDFSRGTTIVPAGLGDSGPLIGAAAVALRHLGLPGGPTL
ncbi:MAG: ROK family protein [Actinomycetota bacterium]